MLVMEYCLRQHSRLFPSREKCINFKTRKDHGVIALFWSQTFMENLKMPSKIQKIDPKEIFTLFRHRVLFFLPMK